MTSKRGIDSIYEDVTERILGLLDEGVVPWRRPWQGGAPGGHYNGSSQKPYRGINQLLLDVELFERGYRREDWYTFKQAKYVGAWVGKGEKGTRLVYWTRWVPKAERIRAKNEDRAENAIPVLKYFTVFNAEQLRGAVPESAADMLPDGESWDAIGEADRAVESMPLRPTILHGGNRACYSWGDDKVRMPTREAFADPESYYGVLFHELAHATGHSSRLDRQSDDGKAAAFGDPVYSREELVAELASSFTCRAIGVAADLEQSAAYIKGWKDRLTGDPRALVWASGRAVKAADWILNRGRVGADGVVSPIVVTA